MFSDKKESVYLQNFTDFKPTVLTPSQNRCTCGNCQVLGRVEACICCHEIEAVQNKNIEAVTSGECEEQPQCITQHPGFHPVCINRWVLQVAWYQYKQQYKAAYDGWEDKLFKHPVVLGYFGERNWSCASRLCSYVHPEFLSSTRTRGGLVFEGFRYADE